MRATSGGGLLFLALILSCLNPALSSAQSRLELEPIVVTKSKIQLLDSYVASPDNSGSSPLEALINLPLDLQSRSLKEGIQTDFSLRGSNFQGVLLLLDGQRINDPQSAHHNSDLPLTREDIEKIEVMPGAASSLFGPDAIGGAINFQLKKPEINTASLEIAAGQYQSGSGLFSITRQKDKLGARLSIENSESAGFSPHTDFKKFTATFASRLDLPQGDFNLSWGYQAKEFGAYDFYTPGAGYPSQEWTKTYLLNTGLNLEKEGFIIRPNFLWRRHYDKFLLDKTLVRSRYLNHHRTDIYTPSLYFQKEAGALGRLGLGVEYGQEQIDSTNLGKHSRRHQSLIMDDSRKINQRLLLGLSFRFDDSEDFGGAYTGSASLRYNFSAQDALCLGISRSLRLPSFTELYYNDPTSLGNPGLSAEQSLNYQAGYSYKKGLLALAATFFFRQEEDFIDWVKRSPGQGQWQVENVSRARVSGIENGFKLEINKFINLDANYTYVNKQTPGQALWYKYGPNYTKHLFNSVLSLALPFGIQEVSLTYKKKPHRQAWLILDTRFTYRFTPRCQIFLDIANTLNVEYQEIAGIPQPGRWAQAGLRLSW